MIAQSFALLSGTIEGPANLEIADTFELSGGTLSTGVGVLKLNSGADFRISGGSDKVQQRPIDNAGTAVWTGGGKIISSAVFNNSGTFDSQNDGTFTWSGANRPDFNNSGTLKKSFGTGTAFFGVNLNNSGTIIAQSGTLQFDAGYVQTAGGTRLGPGRILLTGFAANIQGGGLTGNGNITATVTNSGYCSPGESPGIITVSGAYTQTPAGRLDIELGGHTPSVEFDQLAVTGAATLDGSLNVRLIGGFMPRAGDAFQILTFGSRNGAFAVKNGLNLGNGLVLMPTYGASALGSIR